jgi:putative addiction module component (TIGR02574 family)
MTTEELKSAALQLPQDQRAELARLLIDSLDERFANAVDAAFDAELRKRFDEIRNGTAEGDPAEEVFAALRREFS